MKANILTLLFILSYSGVVFSACSDRFALECLYDVLFGDYDSSEEESVEQKPTNLNHSARDLSSVIHNTEEKLEEIPKILGYLKNLTHTVTHVQHELIGPRLPSHLPNSIEKEEDKSKESHEKEDSSSQSSEEKTTKGDKKNVHFRDVYKELASDLSEIPRLVSNVSKLTKMVKSVVQKLANNPAPKIVGEGKLEENKEASKQSDVKDEKTPETGEKNDEKTPETGEKNDEKTPETK
ncbi:uncharacterized protein LOC129576304 [Sitodiplosis mosellana]|uniref:uncharacterized protein LOC129576304 n=1 Tax=Sitodiplosis mosellana TaxID=263140 RepID=UPI002444A90D|nr:uncharacterized protein LOC129576304 [Sitodiplosis mosellana]XP_055317161.1 uncharacterized protein LOC129576304 [Sitodiplosis mosellana]